MNATTHPTLPFELLLLLVATISCGRERAGETRDSHTGDLAITTVPARLVKPTEARTLAAWPAGVVLVDVRTAEEYDAGHLAGARQIPLDEIGPALDAGRFPFDRETPLLVYCRAGSRSAQAAALLTERGFVQVYDLEGGITAWGERGYPVER